MARRRTARADAGSAGGPKTPGPASCIAPNPVRLTVCGPSRAVGGVVGEPVIWSARRGAASGDAFCAGEMRGQELSGAVQRRGRFVKDRVIGLEDVWHPGGDLERHLNVGGGGLSREAEGVVEEDLVTSGLDAQGRQAGQIGEYRADEAE